MVAVDVAQDDGVFQRELGRRQLGEHEHDVVQREGRRRHQRGGVRRERRVEQREIRQENRAEQHQEAERQRRPAPLPRFDPARRAIFAAQHRIAAAAENELLRLQQQDRQNQQRHRGGGGQFEFWRILEQAPDLRGHGVKAGRQRQDRGRAEQGHGLQERDQGTGDQGRQRQRDRHAPRRGPGPAAENGGGIFEFAGHVVERIGDQHEHEGEGVAGDDENDPGQRIDVEEMLIGIRARHDAVQLVEQSAVGRRQQFPGHRAEERRRHERGRNQGADELPPGHVGARHQPSHRCGNSTAEDGGGGCDDRGGGERVEEIRVGEQRDEILQRQVAGLVGDAVDRKPRHRQHDQRNQYRREQPQNRPGPVDLGLGCVDAGCDGHLSTDLVRHSGAREGANPESRDSPMRNCASEAWSSGPSRNDGENCPAQWHRLHPK